MFKNKHVVAALIITPLLAIGGYFMLDAVVGEKPQAAKAGQSYPLVALPNCRYSSGKCTLKNNEFAVDLLPIQSAAGGLQLRLQSPHTLQTAKLALVNNTEEAGEPIAMNSEDSDGKHWQITLPGPVQQDSQLRLVVAADNALYFGETGLAFLRYEAAVGKDFRTEN